MPTPDPHLDEAVDALQHWDPDPVRDIVRADSGTMNETFLITTARRRMVLRRHRRTRRDQIEFEHAVIAHARTRRIPTPQLISTPAGHTLIEHRGVFYSLFTLARGHQRSRGTLTPSHARSMGAMLAQLDVALADYPLAVEPVRERSADLSPVTASIERLLHEIEQLTEPTEQDRWAEDLLRSKARWLREVPPPSWQSPPVEQLQLVHGDYQDANLFFDADGQVVDVIDWDKTGPGWPPAEAVRAMDHALGMQPQLCGEFIAGYRAVRPLSDEDLELAASNWHFSRVHDHWVLEGIYLRGDDRLRIFLEPGGFVPFAETWRQVRDSATDPGSVLLD